jgi:cob(I)alamin adenosyltransferase
MKLYTKTGDDGTTGLFGGDRVSKDHPRVEAYGTVDEANAAIALAAAACDPSRPVQRRIADILKMIESRLFDLGADLATPADSKHADKVVRLNDADTRAAEQWIDEIDAGNATMKNFVLPGGSELAARLHLARTICRRAERVMVALARAETVTPQAIIFINRLSDLLFAMARRANADLGVSDVPWVKKG